MGGWKAGGSLLRSKSGAEAPASAETQLGSRDWDLGYGSKERQGQLLWQDT